MTINIDTKHKSDAYSLRIILFWFVAIALAVSSVQGQELVPELASDEAYRLDPANLGDNLAAKQKRAEFLKAGKPYFTVESIAPSHGPETGATKVTVRGGPFKQYQTLYPEPKCRFGSDDMIVPATYINCPPVELKPFERAARDEIRAGGATCIACDPSPPSLESKPVEFTVSLIGDFSDSAPAAAYFFFKTFHVTNFQPQSGPKDGDTTIHVWGDNFADYGEYTSCTFGVKSVPAKVMSPNYITCKSPSSDVVSRGMPFAVSLNGQQLSSERLDFWYYRDAQVVAIEPVIGPETGGNQIILKGNNFRPFSPEAGELDASNATYCQFQALNILTKAVVLGNEKASCIAPASYYWKETVVELTLNGADFSDDGNKYYYYKPPFLFDVQPAQGPVIGGTKILVIGTNFNDTGNITCKFGKVEAPGEFVSSAEIACVAPKSSEPGWVDLQVALYPGLYSSPVKYLYYKQPVVMSAAPLSGPASGYTQIQVTGQNFVDLGGNSAVCVFNKTKFTNATVLNANQILCDSPSILNKQGSSEIQDPKYAFYTLDVSIEGGAQASNSALRFSYYQEPKITRISPGSGPIRGGTTVVLSGTGFAQASAFKRLVRIGHLQAEPIAYTNTTITVRVPPVNLPSTTTVSVSLNGQQFTQQPAFHNPGKQITFDYYADPYVSVYSPAKGPINGGTRVQMQGYGFTLGRAHLEDKLWARFFDPASKAELAPPTEVEQLSNDQITWVTPPVFTPVEALVQISLNKQDWLDVKDINTDTSFSLYDSPHINSISPSYGHVKARDEVILELQGTGFFCFDQDCSDLQCRFGNAPHQYIYAKGILANSGLVRCKVPGYTKPDVLKVEVTINGVSYTSDNHTFGFFDPFVLEAQPKLIATDGSTQVSIKGLGFVDSGQAKAQYSNRTHPITCGQSCVKSAAFKDKHTLVAPTFAQQDVKYESGDRNVLWDPIYIDATVIGDEFTDNGVEVFYYQDPVIQNSSITESPANLQSQLLVFVDFRENIIPRLLKYATPTCRFVYNQKVSYSPGRIVQYPFTADRNIQTANAIHCRTPAWILDGEEPEKATLDVSLNGQNYLGNVEFTFLRKLLVHRDVPMSGPYKHSTQLKLLGQGYRLHGRNSSLKWGTEYTEQISLKDVTDFKYVSEDFLNVVPGSQELRAYFTEAQEIPRVDTLLTEAQSYDLFDKSRALMEVEGSLGGPNYVEVGFDEVLDRVADGSIQQQKLYNYGPSSVEFYSYREPLVQKIHPTSGLTRGGSFVEVIGTGFKYMPEYGIVPHCRFGDKVVRAHFDSSVRLVCQSPPNTDTQGRLPFEVSLNGVDWSQSGFQYSYYEEPIMTDIYPDMGSVNGGEDIYVKGEKFTNNTDPAEFKCRFLPVTLKIPPKTIRARFVNATTIVCTSPGGWSEADRVILQVTWNGVDYDENHFQYTFYSIHKPFPRSGPSSGKGGDIVVYGQGFRAETSPACRLNRTAYEPISVTPTEIRCPMPDAEAGDDYFGNVDFAVTANGINWNTFEGGFQYYPQPTVEDIDPKNGPSSGVGIINFYGQGFRADYALAELVCRIGGATGKAYFVSSRQIKCIVENIPLLAEDDDPLPAQVSLNGYSFTELTDDTYFRPYGVLQIQPNSGPTGGATTVIVSGQGFVEQEGITPRCRFGTPANFAIVEGEILSYTRIACRTPEALPLTPTAALPRDVPFAVALSGDEFNPWTSTPHKFRFYEQPLYDTITPSEVEVGRITEVYVTASYLSEFFEPMPLPTEATQSNQDSDAQNAQAASRGVLSPIRCKFGRFGESSAVFLNLTTIKCTSPPTEEPPDSIYRETVVLSIAMNGQEFQEAGSQTTFTFVGTAPYISFATIVMTLLAIAFVGFAGTMCTSDWVLLDQLQGGVNRQPRGGIAGQLRQPQMSSLD